MKNAILMVIAHLPTTVLMLVIGFVSMVAFSVAPFIIFILPAAFTWIQSSILEKVFRRYMSEEDREAEDAKYKEDILA